MPTPQLIDELRPLEIVDKIVNAWATIAVQFFVKDSNSAHKFIGCGSGFIVERHNATFLVTAHHVLKDLIEGDAFAANIGGKGILLNGLGFMKSSEDDIAVAFIDPIWAKKQGLSRTSPLSLNTLENTGINSDIFVLLGFPGSKNKLNLNTNETTRRLVGYSSSRRIEKPCSNTHIRNPIAFYFDKKTATNSDLNKINVGPFNGNSGGPILEVIAQPKSDKTVSLNVKLAGIFIGWDKQHKELICCRPNVIVNLIDRLTAHLSSL